MWKPDDSVSWCFRDENLTQIGLWGKGRKKKGDESFKEFTVKGHKETKQ